MHPDLCRMLQTNFLRYTAWDFNFPNISFKNRVHRLTFGLCTNSMWVGVPGLRDTACDCDIVDSFIGETDRSLLQGSNQTCRYKVHFDWWIVLRAGRRACVRVFVRWLVQSGVLPWENIGNVVHTRTERKIEREPKEKYWHREHRDRDRKWDRDLWSRESSELRITA